MSFRANSYFKKGNYIEAQKYFEKAFDMGLHKFEDREAYVNSIINLPLDIIGQEKLLKFLEYPIEDSVKEKAEIFLYDLKREIHKKYPDNFISQAVFNQKVVRWASLPITYHFEKQKDMPEYFTKEIENAFTEWEKAMKHQIFFSENDKDANIIIKFNAHNPAKEENKKYVVAFTSINVTNKDLIKMQIDFYLKDSQGKYFSQNQVYNTALHEIAHALGFMGHSNEENNVLYITKDSLDVYHDRRDELTSADINTIKLLYDIKPDISNNIKTESLYIPYVVIGDDESVNIAKKREAKIYIKNAPTLPAGWIDLAESYASQEDYPNAIKSLEKALDLADTLNIKRIVYYNLAVCYLQIGNTDFAKDYACKAKEIEDTEDAHLILAETYTKEKKYRDAITEYEILISKNPKNINYTIGLTNIYVIQKEYLKARETLKTYFRANPKDKNNPRLNSYGILKLFL